MTTRSKKPRVGNRRRFLRTAGSGLLLAGCAASAANGPNGAGLEREHGGKDHAEVTPGEDLMQEHGVLERILLVYAEAARRIQAAEPVDLAVVGTAAGIVRRFVEDYHEKLEEDFVFPRLEQAKREVELVAVLRRQHQRGREATDEIVRLATEPKASPRLAELLLGFQRMYRPHAAREDTVLFPAFRGLMTGAAYRELGEQFEEQEHARFGEGGFSATVAEVARLESVLGIADLAGFTIA